MTHPPPPDPVDLARIRVRLKAAIEDRGIPIARLARRSGVSKGTIHKLLDPDATGDLFVGTLLAICREMRMDPRELFTPLPDEEPPA